MDPRKYLNAPRGTVFALTAAILIAGVLLANAVLGFSWALQSRTRQAHGEAIAAQIATGLATYMRAGALTAERLVRDNPAVRGCTISTARAQGACGLARDDPALDSVQFVPLGSLGIAGPDFAPGSLHNNLEINLVGTTLTTGQSGADVFHDGARWVLAITARAQPSEAAPGGVLVLRASLEVLLKEILLPAKPLGEYTLHAGGQREGSIASAGIPAASDADLYLAPTPIPSLQAGFSPDAAFLAATAISGVGLLLPVFGGTFVVAVLVLFGFRQLQVQLRADVSKLSDAALYQRTSTLSVPALYYAELVPLAESLVKVRRDAAAAATKRRPPNEPRDRDALAEEALEIEVVEVAEGAGVHSPPDPETLVPLEVFRDYDVRGHNRLLTPELALALGQAIGSEALERGCSAVVVGADGRETSPMLREQLVRGLLAAGMEVVDVGTLATPMLYFACHQLGTLSGVMVTGSHHPADHNGFKIMLGGETLCGERIAALRNRILEGRLVEGGGSYRVATIEEDYLRAVCDDVLVDKPLKVVVDCANGSASVIAVELFEALGCEVTPLFCELDGRFPNHAPDPSVPSNLRHLLSKVAAQQADLGIAFDGDADRIGVVTGSGRVVTADRLMMLFAGELLSRHPGADIVFDVKCSRDLAAVITRHGGRPIMWRSGHSWIKEKMKETGALLGGEFTGHICFKDRWYGFDDALYCAARLLELLCAESQSLDELVAALPHAIGTPEILVRVPQQRKFALMDAVAKGIALEGSRISRIDGVRAEFADGWGLVRASNTADVLALRFEAQDERALARIQGAFREELRRLLPECELPF